MRHASRYSPSLIYLCFLAFFNSREQVIDQQSNDRSIRLVRWVKTRDAVPVTTTQQNHGSTRKRRFDTKNVEATGSLAAPIMPITMEDDPVVSDEEFVPQVLRFDDRPGQWQCLEDDASLRRTGGYDRALV